MTEVQWLALGRKKGRVPSVLVSLMLNSIYEDFKLLQHFNKDAKEILFGKFCNVLRILQI